MPYWVFRLNWVLWFYWVNRVGLEGHERSSSFLSVAALTIYDMAKAIDKKMTIQNIHLVEKHGGKSGDFYNE